MHVSELESLTHETYGGFEESDRYQLADAKLHRGL